ncbi:MAG: hypothetical protein QOE90_468 [Thermoplasmata archaeon]|nr:hypothetical protein [Thermoplasmata archaeon]
MRSSARLTLAFESPEEAARMAAALAPENETYLRVRVEGATLAAEAEADGPLALLHTLDDALACLSAAQRAGRAAQR